jgi:ferric-dicitrate binding protein FerR (iron transport regulator)
LWLAAVFALTAIGGLWALEAELVYSVGEVQVRRDGVRRAGEIGMRLGAGDVIETGPDGAAILALSDQADLKLRENTILALDTLGEEVSVKLTQGGLFSRVVARLRGRYQVLTETAVAGVRGTEFFVAYGRTIDRHPDIWLCVNDGAVEVAVLETSETVIVEEGKGINIVGGTRLTRPRPYAWTRKLNWNTDPDAGGVIDRTDLEQAYSDLLDQDYD